MRLGDLLPARAGAALLATAVLLGTVACSGADDPGQQPAAPATPEPGPEVRAETATFVLPGDFELDGDTRSGVVMATGPSGDLVSLVEIDFPGEAPDSDRQAEIALAGLGGKFEVEEPVQVDGVEMWHLSGKESQGGFVDVYGAVVDGTSVRLTLRLGNDEYDVEERTAVNEQVLSSWTWAS